MIEDYLVKSVAAGLMGLLFYNSRVSAKKLSECMTRKDIDELIELKMEPYDVKQQDLREDIGELKSKLDKILDILMTQRNS